MLFIKKMLFSNGLLDENSSSPSIAAISTSRPIYLVFDQEPDYPAYVIRKMDNPTALHAHSAHAQLYQLASKLVPKPIGVYAFDGEDYDVQQGVSGHPWFQLKPKFQKIGSQKLLEKRMWRTLFDFHEAINTRDTSSTRHVGPHEELLKAYSLYQCTGEVPSIALEDIVKQAVVDLLRFPICTSISQHGDFCVNNLIIDTDHITVIDFEDFDITKMPLYDHFTLALSLPSFSEKPDDASNVISSINITEEARRLNIPNSLIKWHYLHHLLIRLGPWSTGAKRKTYRNWLRRALCCFLEDYG